MERAIALDPGGVGRIIADQYGEVANDLLAAQEFKHAAHYYDRAIEMGSSNLAHYVGQGRALQAQGEMESALAAYKKVIMDAPESPTTAGLIDSIYHERGDHAGLVQAWRHIAAAHPTAQTPRRHLEKSLRRAQKETTGNSQLE